MIPSVGRIVHFLDREEFMSQKEAASPHAAVITRVLNPTRVDLGVFHPELGYRLVRDVDYGEHVGGWTWPPRADGPGSPEIRSGTPIMSPPARKAPAREKAAAGK